MKLAVWMLVSLLMPVGVWAAQTKPGPTRAEVEAQMGLRSEGDLVRGQMDTVGFVVTAGQAEDAIGRALADERDALAADRRRLAGRRVAGVICPHDDHLYAGRVYVHATELVDAPHVVMIGVFHMARLWGLSDVLVFDRFTAWHGPWGPVTIDPMRQELLAALPADDVVVDDTMHCREHSLEAIVPFLQRHDREVEIVPILVPYMDWDRMEKLAGDLYRALAAVMRRHGWRLGRDVAVVVSADLVHYGPDFHHLPFGTDGGAYERAVARDRELIQDHLEGPLGASRLRSLLYRLTDERDVHRYLIPWCGRFSVPFGLELLRRTAGELGEPVPSGILLRYGTSVSEAELAVTEATRKAGLGYTAPSNFHHWVGYGALSYTLPGEEGGGRGK